MVKNDVAIITAMSKSFVSVNKNISLLQAKQNEIQNKIIGMNKRVNFNTEAIGQNTTNIELNRSMIKQNESDVSFIKDFMYSSMSPKEQLAALESGVYNTEWGHLKETDPEGYQEKKELLELRADFDTYGKRAIGYAQGALEIANNLGVDLPFDNGDIQAVSSAFNAAGDIMSGNYFAAAVKISSLFGGGKGMMPQR